MPLECIVVNFTLFVDCKVAFSTMNNFIIRSEICEHEEIEGSRLCFTHDIWFCNRFCPKHFVCLLFRDHDLFE